MTGFYPHQLKPRPELLDGQFLISPRAELVPASWRSVTHGRWIIAWSPPLDCVPFRDRSGQTLGWLLGHMIHPTLGWVGEGDAIVLEEPGPCGFDQVVNRLRGRFVAIRIEGNALQVFPDAAASLSAVYAPDEECVASTSTLIPLSRATPFVVDWIVWTDIPYESRMYPVGLTPRRRVYRLLPNHVLETGSWDHRRCWPTGDLVRGGDPGAFARVLGDGIRQALTASARVAPLDLSLTAGLDTRLVLACAREVLEHATFYTGHLNDFDSWRDVVASQEIAARFGLRYRVVPWRRPSRRALAEWVIRTGGEAGEIRGWQGCLTLADQVPGSISMTGATGNVLNFGRLRGSRFAEGITPQAVVRRAEVRPRPDFLTQAQRWIDGIPTGDKSLVGDLLFLEQRHGCWGGVIEYGELGRTRARLCPILSIADTRAALLLPIEARAKRGTNKDVIELFWPELLEIPFNKEYVMKGSRVRYYRAKEALARPLHRLRRVIRKTRAQPEYLLKRVGLRSRSKVR